MSFELLAKEQKINDFFFQFAGTGQLVIYGNTDDSTESTVDGGQINGISSTTSSAAASGLHSDMTLYIVFGVALLVFTLAIIIIVKIYKRKNANPNGYTLTSTGT